jgi:hypothetical protein
MLAATFYGTRCTVGLLFETLVFGFIRPDWVLISNMSIDDHRLPQQIKKLSVYLRR